MLWSSLIISILSRTMRDMKQRIMLIKLLHSWSWPVFQRIGSYSWGEFASLYDVFMKWFNLWYSWNLINIIYTWEYNNSGTESCLPASLILTRNSQMLRCVIITWVIPKANLRSGALNIEVVDYPLTFLVQVEEDDLLDLYVKAMACAILGKIGPQRTRVLLLLQKVGC